MRAFPDLGRYLQPKCGELRMGYCDEPYADYQRCPIGKKRPHKKDLFEIYEAHRRGDYLPVEVATSSNEGLDEHDFRVIENEEASV
jgi:thymidylate synthase (FAD)